MEKILCTFCRKSFKDSKTVFFFHSSIKTEEVLFFYIYTYIFVYIKKLSPKWKNCHEQKCFFSDFTYCVKISVDRNNNKEMGGQRGSTGAVQI